MNSCIWLTEEARLGQAASPSQQEILDYQWISSPSPPLPFLHPLPATALLEGRRAGSWGKILWLYMRCLRDKFFKVSLIPESVTTNLWLTTEKRDKYLFTCSENVRYSRMTAKNISLFAEVWYVLKFLEGCCLANSIQARCGAWRNSRFVQTFLPSWSLTLFMCQTRVPLALAFGSGLK